MLIFLKIRKHFKNLHYLYSRIKSRQVNCLNFSRQNTKIKSYQHLKSWPHSHKNSEINKPIISYNGQKC